MECGRGGVEEMDRGGCGTEGAVVGVRAVVGSMVRLGVGSGVGVWSVGCVCVWSVVGLWCGLCGAWVGHATRVTGHGLRVTGHVTCSISLQRHFTDGPSHLPMYSTTYSTTPPQHRPPLPTAALSPSRWCLTKK